MSTRAFWLRIAIGTTVALTLALALKPAQPAARLSPAFAVLGGIAAGGLLFGAAARRRPSLPCCGAAKSVFVGRQLFLALCATNEELIWRRVLLGELLFTGPLAALVLSSASFAVAHRRARLLHIGTGAAFGGVYLATGFLAASIAAHWTYNTLLGAVLERGPP